MLPRPTVSVHLLPALIPPDGLKGGVAVVIDILRATTTMVHALAAGSPAIYPCGEVDEAQALANTFEPGSTLLAGERKGLKIDGFDLGNSPTDCTPEICSGKPFIMTTTNGTRAILAALSAEKIMIGAFANASSTLEALKADRRPIHLICAGTDGQISLEDTLFAGWLAQSLDQLAWEESEAAIGSGELDEDDANVTLFENDSAEIAASLWRETQAMIDEGYPLSDLLADGRGGRRVAEIGLDRDIDEAAEFDRFAFSTQLLRDPLRIVAVPGTAGPTLRMVEV